MYNKRKEMMKAIDSTEFKVQKYLEIYKNHLQEHELDDDSNDITVTDLVDYVENQIAIEGYTFN